MTDSENKLFTPLTTDEILSIAYHSDANGRYPPAHSDDFFKFNIQDGVLKGVDWQYTDEQDLRNLTLIIPEGVVEIERVFTCGMYLPRHVCNIVISDGVKKIGPGVFSACHCLENVTIPDTVSYIGKKAFAGCPHLNKIKLPAGITKISYGTFANCCELEEVYIPDSVKVIETQAFCGCENLCKINFPDNLEEIGDEAFKDCKKLPDFKMPSAVKTVGKDAFEGCGRLSLNMEYYSSLVSDAEKLSVEEPFKALQLLYAYCKQGYVQAAKSICKIIIQNNKLGNPKWPLYEQNFLDYAAELYNKGDKEILNDIQNLLLDNPRTKNPELATAFMKKIEE